MLSKHGRRIVFGFIMLGALALVVVAVNAIIQPAQSRAPRHTSLVVAKGAQVLKVTVWALGVPDPNSQGRKIDIYSVRVKNPNSKKSVLWSANFDMFEKKHGRPTEAAIMQASAGSLTAEYSNFSTWMVPLKPGHTKTVFFVTRNKGAGQYCIGMPDAPDHTVCAPRQ
jgi:hypothetical protein